MAQTDIFKRNFERFLGRAATPGEIDEFNRSGQTATQSIQGLLGSQGFRETKEQQARTQFAPVLERLKGEEIESAQKAQARRRDLPENILGQFSRRGLLRSGGASRALAEGLSGLERQRALERADIAARRSAASQEQANLINQLITQPQQIFQQEQQAEIENRLKQQELDLRMQELLNPGSTKSGGGRRSGGSSKGGGKPFKISQTTIKEAASIFDSVPSDNPNEVDPDEFVSINELNQAIERIIARFGVDEATAEDIANRTLTAQGLTVWETLSEGERSRILAGG